MPRGNSKYYEFIDTFLLVLKKKPLKFLHVYHHIVTLYLVFVALATNATFGWVLMIANCFVHTIMYSYYALTNLGRRPWWKKYLTKLQIAQFFVDMTGIRCVFLLCRFFVWFLLFAFVVPPFSPPPLLLLLFPFLLLYSIEWSCWSRRFPPLCCGHSCCGWCLGCPTHTSHPTDSRVTNGSVWAWIKYNGQPCLGSWYVYKTAMAILVSFIILFALFYIETYNKGKQGGAKQGGAKDTPKGEKDEATDGATAGVSNAASTTGGTVTKRKAAVDDSPDGGPATRTRSRRA